MNAPHCFHLLVTDSGITEATSTATHPRTAASRRSPPCTCEIIAPGTRDEYRCLNRDCPRHGDAAEAARRHRAL